MLRATLVIVRVLSRCDLEAHLTKETYCKSLKVLERRVRRDEARELKS